MSNVSDNKLNDSQKTETLKRFYRHLAEEEYNSAQELSRQTLDMATESDKVVMAVLKLRQQLQKYLS
jgi:hypothetical protein